MKPKASTFTNQLVEFHRPHGIFGLRTNQELKRAERYCEFLSLVMIDIASLTRFPQKVNKSRQDFCEIQQELENIIRKSVRETDVVSGFEDNRLALLLSETPREGANCLCDRLREGIKAFASNLIKVPHSWEVPVEIVSFPDKEDGRERFLAFTQRFQLG